LYLGLSRTIEDELNKQFETTFMIIIKQIKLRIIYCRVVQLRIRATGNAVRICGLQQCDYRSMPV